MLGRLGVEVASVRWWYPGPVCLCYGLRAGAWCGVCGAGGGAGGVATGQDRTRGGGARVGLDGH
jgi:hypothetical protein